MRKVSMTGGARDAGIVPDREGGREVPGREGGRKTAPGSKSARGTLPVSRTPDLCGHPTTSPAAGLANQR